MWKRGAYTVQGVCGNGAVVICHSADGPRVVVGSWREQSSPKAVSVHALWKGAVL